MFSLGHVRRRIPCLSRGYAMSLLPGRPLPGQTAPRVFSGRKGFQYNNYMQILKTTHTSPLIFLSREDFSAERLKKLRIDLLVASSRVPPPKDSQPIPSPTLTVIHSGVFGAALRDFPDINIAEAEKMIEGITGGYAILSIPMFHPPYLSAILRALDRSVPPRPKKTEEEIAKQLAAKNADPATPGRRMKRQRAVLVPELKVLGALIEGKILLPPTVKDVANLPTLDTLRSQIVGLLSTPATQLAAVLGEASGGRLARTLEGYRQALEKAGSSNDDASS
ncbi:hypothetical protein EV421DRAFT_1749125 [Armillaria borealis]|uniref:50S ribosomal protein L10 n=1 Tax=Armillaria borealis TaxID=47425 RepID=A0AA39N3C1_9AGAR|nr:hypothetical protein EV421DRAFT_1749125 [Armillaria borealis]